MSEIRIIPEALAKLMRRRMILVVELSAVIDVSVSTIHRALTGMRLSYRSASRIVKHFYPGLAEAVAAGLVEMLPDDKPRILEGPKAVGESRILYRPKPGVEKATAGRFRAPKSLTDIRRVLQNARRMQEE
jgi:hypothetical protein